MRNKTREDHYCVFLTEFAKGEVRIIELNLYLGQLFAINITWVSGKEES